MVLRIIIPDEFGAKLEQQATALGKDPAAIATEAVIEKLSRENGSQSAAISMTPQQWSAELHSWAASHPRLEHMVDDSRDSIYDGRGE